MGPGVCCTTLHSTIYHIQLEEHDPLSPPLFNVVYFVWLFKSLLVPQPQLKLINNCGYLNSIKLIAPSYKLVLTVVLDYTDDW